MRSPGTIGLPRDHRADREKRSSPPRCTAVYGLVADRMDAPSVMRSGALRPDVSQSPASALPARRRLADDVRLSYIEEPLAARAVASAVPRSGRRLARRAMGASWMALRSLNRRRNVDRKSF
jgi:hypothetical protein